MRVKVGISNRHIHLTKEDANILFGDGYKFVKKKDLSQVGEYACEEVVKISTDKYEFPYVRVLLPFRKYTQVEVSREDALLLGINPPIRDSGDLDNSESVYIEGPNGKIFKENCCIIANRHIHCNKMDGLDHNNGDIVKTIVNGEVMDDIHIKMNDNYILELHIDKTDAKKYGLKDGDYIEIE